MLPSLSLLLFTAVALLAIAGLVRASKGRSGTGNHRPDADPTPDTTIDAGNQFIGTFPHEVQHSTHGPATSDGGPWENPPNADAGTSPDSGWDSGTAATDSTDTGSNDSSSSSD